MDVSIFTKLCQQKDHNLWFTELLNLKNVLKQSDTPYENFALIIQEASRHGIDPAYANRETVCHAYVLYHCILLSAGRTHYENVICRLKLPQTPICDFLVTPLLDTTSDTHYLAPAIALFGDIVNVTTPIDVTNTSSQVIIFNSLNYTNAITPTEFVTYRRKITTRMGLPKIIPPDRYPPNTIGIYMPKYSENGVEYRCVLPLLQQLVKKYHVRLFIPAGNGVPECVTDFVHLPPNILQSLPTVLHCRVKVMLFVTHVETWATVLCHARIGETQIALLGNTHTSGLPNMDYYMTPPWDSSYYTERRLSIPHLGCNLSAFSPSNLQPLHNLSPNYMIYCPWSTMKITRQAVNTLLQIQELIPTAVFVFHIFNPQHHEIVNAKLALFCDETNLQYMLTDGGLSEYYQLYSACNIAITSYPFGGFTTVIDALYHGCPIYTIDNIASYSGQSGARILEYFGLHRYTCTLENMAQTIYRSQGIKHHGLPSREQIDAKLAEINTQTTDCMMSHINGFLK